MGGTGWVYKHTETTPGGFRVYTTGFYDPDGTWHTDQDFNDKDEAADRVHYLNGGDPRSRRWPDLPMIEATSGSEPFHGFERQGTYSFDGVEDHVRMPDPDPFQHLIDALWQAKGDGADLTIIADAVPSLLFALEDRQPPDEISGGREEDWRGSCLEARKKIRERKEEGGDLPDFDATDWEWWVDGLWHFIDALYGQKQWQPVEGSGSGTLKKCPDCGHTALEGEARCSECGGGPYGDREWRLDREVADV